MKTIISISQCALLLLIGALAAPGAVLADKPEGAGRGKGKDKHERAEQRDDDRGGRQESQGGGKHEGKRDHFKDQDRVYVREYFTEHYGNAGSRNHAYGWSAEEAVEKSRNTVRIPLAPVISRSWLTELT